MVGVKPTLCTTHMLIVFAVSETSTRRRKGRERRKSSRSIPLSSNDPTKRVSSRMQNTHAVPAMAATAAQSMYGLPEIPAMSRSLIVERMQAIAPVVIR